jgi:DNA replication protein DnaC
VNDDAPSWDVLRQRLAEALFSSVGAAALGRRALADLAGGHADGTWTRRLRELARPAVLVLDDFAMRELTPAQADDLYELINEHVGRSLTLTSNRSPVDWYPLFPNPVVAESLLDRLINNSHQLLMDGASYRPNKRPGRVVPQDTTTTR